MSPLGLGLVLVPPGTACQGEVRHTYTFLFGWVGSVAPPPAKPESRTRVPVTAHFFKVKDKTVTDMMIAYAAEVAKLHLYIYIWSVRLLVVGLLRAQVATNYEN